MWYIAATAWKAFLQTFWVCIAPLWKKWLDVKDPAFLGWRHNSRWTHAPQNMAMKQNGDILSAAFKTSLGGAQKIEDSAEKNLGG